MTSLQEENTPLNRSLDRRDEADQITQQARELGLQQQRLDLSWGEIYSKITQGHPALYHVAGFKTFGAWLESVGSPHHESQAYSRREVYLALRDYIDPAIANVMPLNNARDFLLLPESKRTEELARRACSKTNKEFRQIIDGLAPGLALPQHDYKGFQLEKEARPVVDLAIQVAKDRHGCTSDGSALEYVCEQFLLREGVEMVAEKKSMEGETVQ